MDTVIDVPEQVFPPEPVDAINLFAAQDERVPPLVTVGIMKIFPVTFDGNFLFAKLYQEVESEHAPGRINLVLGVDFDPG